MRYLLILAVLGLSGCATFKSHCHEDGGIYARTATLEVCMKQIQK